MGDFWKEAVSWDLKPDEASWFLDLRIVGLDGTVSIVEIVFLSPRVEKPKSQEGNKSFIP